MPMYKIRESDIPGLGVGPGRGTVVKVDVLEAGDTTTMIRVEDCGVAARQGQVHSVPSSAVYMWYADL